MQATINFVKLPAKVDHKAVRAMGGRLFISHGNKVYAGSLIGQAGLTLFEVNYFQRAGIKPSELKNSSI